MHSLQIMLVFFASFSISAQDESSNVSTVSRWRWHQEKGISNKRPVQAKFAFQVHSGLSAGTSLRRVCQTTYTACTGPVRLVRVFSLSEKAFRHFLFTSEFRAFTCIILPNGTKIERLYRALIGTCNELLGEGRSPKVRPVWDLLEVKGLGGCFKKEKWLRFIDAGFLRCEEKSGLLILNRMCCLRWGFPQNGHGRCWRYRKHQDVKELPQFQGTRDNHGRSCIYWYLCLHWQAKEHDSRTHWRIQRR